MFLRHVADTDKALGRVALVVQCINASIVFVCALSDNCLCFEFVTRCLIKKREKTRYFQSAALRYVGLSTIVLRIQNVYVM